MRDLFFFFNNTQIGKCTLESLNHFCYKKDKIRTIKEKMIPFNKAYKTTK